MKKLCLWILVILSILSLTACSSSARSGTYTVTRDGKEYTVDRENGTISDGTDTYRFTLTGDSSEYHLEIICPDGSSYWWTRQESNGFASGMGGWSDDFDESRYFSVETLRDILEEGMPARTNSQYLLIALVLAVIGGLNVAAPRVSWYLEYGWRFRDAEPSEAALFLNRCGGVLALIVAVILLLAGL